MIPNETGTSKWFFHQRIFFSSREGTGGLLLLLFA